MIKSSSNVLNLAAIFAEKGYHSTSIRDIARATEMSLSGLYYYFKSKDELAVSYQDYVSAQLSTIVNKLLDGVQRSVHR